MLYHSSHLGLRAPEQPSPVPAQRPESVLRYAKHQPYSKPTTLLVLALLRVKRLEPLEIIRPPDGTLCALVHAHFQAIPNLVPDFDFAPVPRLGDGGLDRLFPRPALVSSDFG